MIEGVDKDIEGRPSPTDQLGRDSLQNENKGQLVEQILEQIGEGEGKHDVKKMVEMEWENEGKIIDGSLICEYNSCVQSSILTSME